MKRIKVLHLTKSEGLYGAERVILNLLEHFDAERFDVRLAALVEERNPHRELLEEAARRGHQTLAIPCRKRLDAQSWRELLRVINENEIEVLHCHEIKSRFYGLPVAKRLKLPIVATNHNWIRKNLLVSAMEYWDAFALRFFDRVVAVSEEVRQLMLQLRIPPRLITVVSNGIAANELNQNGAAALQQAWGIAEGERVVGAIGRLSIEKGFKHFLEAAKIVSPQMPKARFLIAGDGPLENELKQHAQSLGIAERVIFAGFQKNVAALYPLLDVFALTSLREGTPMALLEAMAAGVPVVATAVGGVPKIVRDRDNGMLVPARNAPKIAEALTHLLSHRDEAARLAVNAQRTIHEKYSAATMARQYENIYAALAKPASRNETGKAYSPNSIACRRTKAFFRRISVPSASLSGKVFDFFTLCMTLLYLLCPAQTRAEIIFVDNRLDQDCAPGNYSIANRNGAGSDGAAYRTIQKALNSAAAADSIYIRAGIYNEAIEILQSGKADKYFMLRNYPGEQAILDGKKSLPAADRGLIFLSGKSRIKIIGLTLINSRCYGVRAVNCNDLILQECEVAHSNHGGIVCENGSRITIDGCRVHHNNELGLSAWHEAVTLNGVNTFEVANCEIYANKEEGIDAKYGATNGLIHHNQVYDNNGPNIYIDAANHIEIYSNRVHGASNTKTGIMLGVENHEKRYDTHDVKIYDNQIYDNAGGVAFWLDWPARLYGEFYNVEIMNNFIHSNNKRNWGGVYLQNGGPGNYGGGLIIRNNTFWQNTATEGAQTIRDDAGVISKFSLEDNLFKK